MSTPQATKSGTHGANAWIRRDRERHLGYDLCMLKGVAWGLAVVLGVGGCDGQAPVDCEFISRAPDVSLASILPARPASGAPCDVPGLEVCGVSGATPAGGEPPMGWARCEAGRWGWFSSDESCDTEQECNIGAVYDGECCTEIIYCTSTGARPAGDAPVYCDGEVWHAQR